MHGFSGAAMIWGLFLCHVKNEPSEYENLQWRLKGQLWDSPFLEGEKMPEVTSSLVFSESRPIAKAMFSAYTRCDPW